jgi:hypothetical protein
MFFEHKMKLMRLTFLYFLMFIFSVFFVKAPLTRGMVSIQLEGFVHGADETPINNASILLWGFQLEAETFTDQLGHFAVNASTDETVCTLYAFYDDPDTPGVDLLPSAKIVRTISDISEQINFTLVPAATINIIGQLRPVESTNYIRKYAFEVVDPSTEVLILIGDYKLVYGTGMNVQNYFLDLDPSTIIVPADTPFIISVSSSYQYERTQDRRRWFGWHRTRQRVETFTSFDMVEGDCFIMGGGEVMRLDIRKYSLRFDLIRVEQLRDEVAANLTLVESKGFYTTSERHQLQRARELEESAVAKLESNAYDDSYVDMRQAYLKLTGIQTRLKTIMVEASVSVNILVFFIALTSVTLAILLTENRLLKLLYAVAVYALMLFYLYNIYPGCGIISLERYIQSSVISVSVVLLAASVLPSILNKSESEGGIAKLGALAAVFSMAKRNLKRRRLRTVFTFSTILTLTMSFVALTSFSTSYGLIYTRYNSKEPGASGIVIRMPSYKPNTPYEEGWFYAVIEPVVEWVAGNEGITNVALKAENTPTLRPYASIDGWPIFGILGVQPDREPMMQSIDEAVVEGDLLREDGTCLLHESLLHSKDISIGDYITIRDVRLKVVGAFNSQIMDVNDMDGESILPKYQINYTPGADVPIIGAETCEAREVAIMTLDTSLQISRVYTSRISTEIEQGVDTETLGKSMALSREYRFWVSEEGVVHLTYMGSQLGGKGLPLLVPWAIVVLNVVTTMMNAMFERQREINILSSIGLNPAHISGVFLAEASIIGVVAGGFGYLLGLGLYPLMLELSIAPMVQQKISAVWCLAAIGIAMASVIIGSVIALERSILLTPSLKRRWSIGEQPMSLEGKWKIPMPVQFEERFLESFISFVKGFLGRYGDKNYLPYIYALKTAVEERDERQRWTVSFNYNEGQSSLGGNSTSNIMTIAKETGADVYSVMLESKGERSAAHRTGTFIRNLIIKWSTERNKLIE